LKIHFIPEIIQTVLFIHPKLRVFPIEYINHALGSTHTYFETKTATSIPSFKSSVHNLLRPSILSLLLNMFTKLVILIIIGFWKKSRLSLKLPTLCFIK